NGILFEAVCNLQYAKPAEFNKGEWTDVPNGRVIYCSSLEDLVKKLNRRFLKIQSQKGPQATIHKDTSAITIKTNNLALKFSTELRRLLDFDANQINVKGTKTSRMIDGSLDLPRTWPIYCTLQDALEPNAFVPGSGQENKTSRREAILYYVDLSPDDHAYETVYLNRLIWCRLSLQTVHKVRLAFHYAATGNVLRTVGHGDDFTLNLLEKKRLCLGL
ncbi:MAG: hypothetical protein GY820_10245, partial [Gammaproteobacteria bacterium]|nr:hypothetical protein [Gammaproteobacteria bacterium]